jgi:hypothetical protein
MRARVFSSAFVESSKKEPRNESGAAKPGLRNGYCFICGLALLVGVNLEPLWLFADMYILLWCLVV